jgi:hypothetical protein
MSKEAVFTMKLESDLRQDFMTEVADEGRPASQVVRELMRGYIEARRQTREHDAYLKSKVEAGRVSMHAGEGRSNEEVEAAFAARRKLIAAS